MDEKIQDGGNVKRIIDMLRNSRKDQKVNVEQLCAGICTKSMLEKVERGERTINRNCLNRLLARLGIDQKKYEKYLYYSDYDEWKEKNDIINAIEDGELEKAEVLVCKYEEERTEAGKIELQFCLFMKAQILQHKGEDANADEIEALYREAMLLTVPGAYEEETSKLLLSTDELNLVLECRNRELYGEDVYEIFDIYKGFIEYIDNSRFDISGKAKIYPKVVVYMYNHIATQIDKVSKKEKTAIYKTMMELCENAIDILREDCKAYYLSEVFMAYIEILSYLVKVTHEKSAIEKYEEYLEWAKRLLNTYIEVCHKYEISHLMRECCYLYREENVYCINDVILKRRKMLGMTMTKLCDNICSTRTLRRFERKECNALEGIVDELLWRLGISDEYVNMGIVTDSQEVVELYQQYRRALNAKELDKAQHIVEELETRLLAYAINRQVILRAKSMIKLYKKEVTPEEHIEDLIAVLKCTIDLKDIKVRNVDAYYSWSEISCIHAISMAMKKSERYKEAYDNIQCLIEYFEYFESQHNEDMIIGLYEVVMSFYGSLLGSMGMIDESNIIFDKLNKLSLKLKRTNVIHFNIYNIAWNSKEIDCNKIKYYSDIRKSISLCQLTKNKYYESTYKKMLQ